MSETTARRCLDDFVIGRLQEAEFAQTYGDILSRLKQGFYGQEYVNALFQPFRRAVGIGEAYVFGQLHWMIINEEIAHCHIDVGTRPRADRMVQENDAALKNLPAPFIGEFWGELADCDGGVSWSEPLNWTDQTVEPGTAPLEVGYTDASRTFLHLFESGCLARWPYGDDKIWLFVMRPEAHARWKIRSSGKGEQQWSRRQDVTPQPKSARRPSKTFLPASRLKI